MEENNTVVGEICHIEGVKPRAARYNPNQTDETRHSFDNLILMCSLHHKIIDEDDESYTVERLLKIKADHEQGSSASVLSDEEQHKFEQLLDNRIRLIIEHEKTKAEQSVDERKGSASVALAKEMADMRRFEEKKRTIRSSYDGLEQIIDSVNAIFVAIDELYRAEEQNLKVLGIQLHQDEKHRVVATDEFGSQVVLEGFDGFRDHSLIPDTLRLEMMVFGKRPVRQPGTEGMFYTNPISGDALKPDFDQSLSTVWVDSQGTPYNKDALVEKVFKDLLVIIDKEHKIAETLPEGTYRRGGLYTDMWGNPISDDGGFDT